MSGRRRQRDALAPSLFPFLAVLLCTMGSLVLILMLIVSQAQTQAHDIAREAVEKREEVESLAAQAIRTYEEQLDEQQLQLEKRRLALQHFESHIVELSKELESLQQTAQRLQDKTFATIDAQEYQDKLSDLEQQLVDAEEELSRLLKNPDRKKPVFAIVPYQGPNGTHRRPIYLECTASGLTIQPEGVALSLASLRPPHGPGNPLDAALRTIRSEYRPASGAINQNAYPLLLVRPDGIRTYAMARSALSSWDDQFGYELIEQDLELVFPESVAGLKEKVAAAIDLARQRQAALVAAMPEKYNRLSGSFGGRAGAPGGSAFNGQGGMRDFSGEAGGDGNSLTGQRQDALTLGSGTEGRTENRTMATNADDAMTAGAGGFEPGDLNFSPDQALAGLGQPFGVDSRAGFDATNSSGSGASPSDQPEAAMHGYGSGSSRSATASGSAPQSGSGAADGMRGSSFSAPTMSQDQRPNGASETKGAPSQLELSAGSHERTSDSQPVSERLGGNWAWSNRNQSRTPVVRSIHVHCFADRWIVLPDDGNTSMAETILYDRSPEERAFLLADIVKKRVDSWGLAIAGGYWKPVLSVDVAPNAQWRFDQLKQLMHGSGIEINLRTSTAGRQREPQKR